LIRLVGNGDNLKAGSKAVLTRYGTARALIPYPHHVALAAPPQENEERKRAKMEREEAAAKAKAVSLEPPQPDAWLLEDIVVKVIHKELAEGRYYKRKGVVTVGRR
jgi:hypothetical protein